MRQLKTPEELIKSVGLEFYTKALIELVTAAQRDALECAAENAVCIEDDEKVDKSSILNLMPKEK